MYASRMLQFVRQIVAKQRPTGKAKKPLAVWFGMSIFVVLLIGLHSTTVARAHRSNVQVALGGQPSLLLDANDDDGVDYTADLDDDNDGIPDDVEGCLPPLDTNEFGFDETLMVVAYHGLIAKTINNGYAVWGGSAAPSPPPGETATDDNVDLATPTDITPANGYNYSGEIVDATVAAAGDSNSDQYFILTTDGLYTWGKWRKASYYRVTLHDNMYSVKDGDYAPFQEIALPPGVAASDIKSIEATAERLALLTNDGEIWIAGYSVISGHDAELYADGSTSDDDQWHHVLTGPGGPPLSGIQQIKLAPGNAVALDDQGRLWTWGVGVALGNGTGPQNADYPTLMTLPSAIQSGSADLVQFEITARNRSYVGDDGSGIQRVASYFILDSTGKVHVLGQNTELILGIGNTDPSYFQSTWTYMRNPDNTGDMTDVHFIQVAHHSAYTLSGALITADGTLYEWGSNDTHKIGAGDADFVPLPRVPDGFTPGSDKAAYVAPGGHLVPYFGEDGKYYNVGHKKEGGFGDGDTSGAEINEYEPNDEIPSELAVSQLGTADTDGDGCPNCRDLDSDNDGISDLIESGLDPALDANHDGRVDSTIDNDGDGLMASVDADDSDANADPAGVITSDTIADTDGDDVANFIDLDSDGDGIPDAVEAQPTSNYQGNDGDVSDDVDENCAPPYEVTTPVDTDSDGIPDYADTDADNDGINDVDESGLTLSGTDDNGDGIDDGLNASYQDPDGDIDDPMTDLRNTDADPSDVDYRSVEADLALSKSVDPTEASAGDIVTFTLTLSNNGSGPATNVEVTDVVPDGYEYVAGSIDGDAGSTGATITTDDSGDPTLKWAIDALDNGESVTLTFQAEVQPTGERQNTAEITASDQVDPDDSNNSDDATITYKPEADLSVTKDDGRTLIVAGDTVVYTIVVTNNGPNDAMGSTVTDAKPAAITSWTWECDSTTGGASGCDGVTDSTDDFSDTVDLPVGASITYKVTAQVADDASGTLENTVEVALPSGVTDPNTDDNTATDSDGIAETGKSITDTNQDFTTGDNVAIGEILTYETSLNIPPGQTVNLTLTDVMDRGLAFVACESITASGTLTSTAGSLDEICADPVVSAEPPGSTAAEDQGRKVVWNFGTVENATTDDITLTVRYQVVVLNNEGNQSGTSLANEATWSWEGGEVQANADPVTVVEPDLEIHKSASPTTVLPGEEITFTLEIQHTGDSEVAAYDVEVTDELPSGLNYVDGSLTAVDGPTPTSMNYDAATRTIEVTWDMFDLGDVSHIEFKATLSSSAEQNVTNTASVAWSSLPGDVSTPQSRYNMLSTERYYDPASPVNIYQTAASVLIQVVLPETGFAPGRVAAVPEQKVAYQHTAIELEIPKLGVEVPVVGVPRTAEGWDLTWLWDQAGWLEGSAYPTWPGNTIITGHVYLPDGEPGPFVDLRRLMWGDKVILHANGKRYEYEVRVVQVVRPDDVRLLGHKDRDWVTLITCQGYDEESGTYRWRLIVQAVLVKVTPEG